MSDSPIAANDWKRAGLTTSVLIRRGIFALVAIVSLAALALAALPLVASTQLVRNRIAIELSAWSGFRVAIASTPQIEVWPTFKAVLSGVTLYQWDDWDNPAVIEAERVEIDLSAIDALSGNVSFTEAKLINPVLRIGTDTGQPGPDSIPSGGRIVQAVDTVRALIASDPDRPDFARFPATSFGSIDIQNGRVVTIVNGEQRDVVTRLGGRVEWPALNAAGRASLTGVWRGEEVKADLSADSPLALLAGGATRVVANWESGPLMGRLDGTVRTAADGRIEARVAIDAPSVRRAIAWTGTRLAIGSALGAVKASGTVGGDWRRLNINDAAINIDGDAGTGMLSIAPFEPRPNVSGRLAFAKLDVESLVAGLSPLMSYDRPLEASASLSDLIDVKLDLTAQEATIHEKPLTALVGAVNIDRQTAAFLLTEAKALGGIVQGELRLEEKLGAHTTAIELKAKGVDGLAFAEALGLPNMAPAAKGDVVLRVTGKGQAIDAMLAFANGSISAQFGPGELRGLDLAMLISKTTGGGFFPLTEISKGVLAIDAAELEATIEDGVGRIQKAVVRAGQKTISLSGIMPYAGRGVALSGAVTSLDRISLFNPFGREATFFVGGSWDAPFVSAALPSQLPQ